MAGRVLVPVGVFDSKRVKEIPLSGQVLVPVWVLGSKWVQEAPSS